MPWPIGPDATPPSGPLLSSVGSRRGAIVGAALGAGACSSSAAGRAYWSSATVVESRSTRRSSSGRQATRSSNLAAVERISAWIPSNEEVSLSKYSLKAGSMALIRSLIDFCRRVSMRCASLKSKALNTRC